MNGQQELLTLKSCTKSRGHISGLTKIFGLLGCLQGLFPSETPALPGAEKIWPVPELQGNYWGFAHQPRIPMCSPTLLPYYHSSQLLRVTHFTCRKANSIGAFPSLLAGAWA